MAGFNPVWNENFQFDVYVPELALVRFVVEDYDSASDNEFIAQYTLPFDSLQMGEFMDIFLHTVTQWPVLGSNELLIIYYCNIITFSSNE